MNTILGVQILINFIFFVLNLSKQKHFYLFIKLC